MLKENSVRINALGFILLTAVSLFFAVNSSGSEDAKVIFGFKVVDTQEIAGFFHVLAGEEIEVDWGDGSRETFREGRQNYSKKYGDEVSAGVVVSAPVYDVKIYAGKEAALTGFRMSQSGAVIKFDLRDLPGGLRSVSVEGDNTVAGDIGDLPEGLTSLDFSGSNTITGDISDLPEGLNNFNCYGDNTITGDIEGLPRGLTNFRCAGLNTIKGDIKHLPENLEHFYCHGRNAVSGDISNLPDSITRFLVRGNNIIEGNISSIPAGLTDFDCRGRNTLTGDVSKLPAGITRFQCSGLNSISNYSPGRIWADGMAWISLAPAEGYGLSTGEIDSLLIDLSGTSWSGPKRIDIGGNNDERSNASDEAVAALEKAGVRVNTN